MGAAHHLTSSFARLAADSEKPRHRSCFFPGMDSDLALGLKRIKGEGGIAW